MKTLILCAALAATASAEVEVSPDRKATFRINAPKASDVTLTVDWENAAQKMTKDDKGVWSLTVGPLAPATYIYSFNVDGITMADPVNPRMKLRARGSGSLFDVPPGDTTAMWEPHDVPHGSVEIDWQKSSVLGDTRAIWVYTPPGYTAETARKYPVFYLLHGSNDTAAGWTTAGGVNFIMDNLIAAKKAVPMIVVMPFGHAQAFGGGRGAPGAMSNTLLYEQYLLKDVMPTVEKKYRINAAPDMRAIAGQSMGGEQAFAIGFGHTELFHSIGGFSPSMPRELADRWGPLLADAKGTNGALKTVWIGCGRQDPSHLSASRRLDESMQKAGVKHTYVETEGAHNYAIWQQHMVEFAPLLFR